MSEFNAREQAFEKKFGVSEETKFRVASRAAKLFGLWAAGQLGLQGAAAEAYSEQAVETIMDRESHGHLLDKTEKDLHAKGTGLTRHRLEREYDECFREARKQIASQS